MKKIFVTMMMVVMMMAMVGCGTKEDKVVTDTTPTITEDTITSEEVISKEPEIEVNADGVESNDVGESIAKVTAEGTVYTNDFQLNESVEVAFADGTGMHLGCQTFSKDEFTVFQGYEDGTILTITFEIDKDYNILSVEIVE